MDSGHSRSTNGIHVYLSTVDKLFRHFIQQHLYMHNTCSFVPSKPCIHALRMPAFLVFDYGCCNLHFLTKIINFVSDVALYISHVRKYNQLSVLYRSAFTYVVTRIYVTINLDHKI